jgi:hypothetical protein
MIYDVINTLVKISLSITSWIINSIKLMREFQLENL